MNFIVIAVVVAIVPILNPLSPAQYLEQWMLQIVSSVVFLVKLLTYPNVYDPPVGRKLMMKLFRTQLKNLNPTLSNVHDVQVGFAGKIAGIHNAVCVKVVPPI
ncbi:MAG: hypothetical protein A2Z45_02175 [Chloroflexi bacterium RBG_19FT_COMBO_55_16]|nr:MAG: hypothetical protein A2Z45_02175 [Chloroflexi bacterium RBG_19FT_COMBO_55_16]